MRAAPEAVIEDEAAPVVEPAAPWWHRIPPPSAPQVLLAGAVGIWTWYFTQRSLDIHHALGTATYDSALYDQGMWLLSRFEAPFVTLMGRNLFGDHTSFALLVLVPLYWIAPGAWIMFTAQSAFIAAGAIPVFLYGRRRLGSEWLALVGSGAYLLHPAVGWTNLENFHPDSFLGVFVGFAIYAALERKWRLYAVFVVLSLLVKEDVALVIVPLGVWVALRRDRRIGLLTILGAVAFAAVAMLVVMRSLIGVPTRNGWRIPFGGPWGVIDTALTNPTALLDHLRSDGRPWYLVQMTAPFAWLFARLPDVAAISGVVLFTNILSTFWYQYQVEFHYGLVAVPALVIGTVYAIGAMRSHDVRIAGVEVVVPARHLAVGVLAAASLVGAALWSPTPIGGSSSWYGRPQSAYAEAAREVFAEIPADAVVAAHYRLTPHLAHRSEIYQFPVPFRVVLYGADDSLEGTRIDDRAERVEYVMLPVDRDEQLQRDWAAIDDAFEEIERNRFWVLYRRDPAVALPG
ncbi:MAG TPA: DUF2079 domain-containing protein [Ilumatobacteraceae bacterium]|nr:DUF2079 domain-containing protein [Ilumatobacteraceae bacterium]